MPNGQLQIKKNEVTALIQNFDFETLPIDKLFSEIAEIMKKIGEYRKILGR